MKLSVEAKVAAAVAMAFVALSIGAIAQEQTEHGTAGVSQISLQDSMSGQDESGKSQFLAQY